MGTFVLTPPVCLSRVGRYHRVNHMQSRKRLGVALLAGTVAGLYTVWYQAVRAIQHSDFSIIWASAYYWRQGLNPYEVIGPDKLWHWDWPQLYPLPAILVGLPFSFAPLWLAEALFVGIGVGCLVWALYRHQPQALWIVLTVGFWVALDTAQWSPILTAATLMPGLGWLLIAKPSIGLPLFLAYPTRSAAVGCAIVGILSIALWPWWVPIWMALTREAHHVTAPFLLTPAGWILPLALLKWRRPEARLLAGLSLIPHTHGAYDVVPLALVITCMEEGLLLVGAMVVQQALLAQFGAGLDVDALYVLNAKLLVWCVYLPCLGMILRRPNVGFEWTWRRPAPVMETA
jgi:hypothetical protein